MMNWVLITSVLAILVLGGMASYIDDKLGLIVLGTGLPFLAWKRREHSEDVIGLFVLSFCVVPFFRRLHDFRTGFTPSSLVLMAPYLLFLPLVADIVHNIKKLRRPTLVPFIAVLLALTYGIILGIVNNGLLACLLGSVEWWCGPIFFCYMALCDRKVNLRRLGTWLTCIMLVESIYGLYQWTSPPPWDARWLVDSKMISSMGSPEPFMMRTFGTLNSTGIFAFFCTYYLVAGIEWTGYILLAPITIAALVTSMVRAGWIISILGITMTVVLQPAKAKAKSLFRFAVIGGILMVSAVPMLGKFEALVNRFNTLQNISADPSYRARQELMDYSLQMLAKLPQGAGLGSEGSAARFTNSGIAGIDNGFISIAYDLGWFGAIVYITGLLVLLGQALVRGRAGRHPEGAAFGAIVLALVVSNIFGSSFSGVGSFFCWSSLGICYLASLPDPAVRAGESPIELDSAEESVEAGPLPPERTDKL